MINTRVQSYFYKVSFSLWLHKVQKYSAHKLKLLHI